MRQNKITISRLVGIAGMRMRENITRKTDPSIADIFWESIPTFLYVTLVTNINRKTLNEISKRSYS